MPFSIDNYLNPYYPSSIVPYLPKPIQRVLGQHKDLKSFNSSILLYIDVLIGTFVSVLMIEGVFMNSKIFIKHHSPTIIASYGASAILAFNANASPLAQPRNIICGHFLSGLVGVIIQKLFELSSIGIDHLYIGGALSVGIASVVMSIFNCVHPPCGASALLPLIDNQIRSMGWWFLPAHLVSSILMISTACVTNNVFRKYPLYWWTPYKKEKLKDEEEKIGKGDKINTSNRNNEGDQEVSDETIRDPDEPVRSENAQRTTMSEGTIIPEDKIVVTMSDVMIPKGIILDDEEVEMLKNVKIKLAAHFNQRGE